MNRISIIGDLFCDILASTQNLPTWGTDTLASGIQLLPGGSAFNSAVYASKYTRLKEYPIQISLYGAVGNDMFSGIMKKAIHDNDIVDHVVARPGARTGSCIVMSSNKDRCFITDRGVVDEMKLEWFEESESDIIPPETRHLHVGGYYNLGVLKAELESLLKRALSLGIHTSLNPQYDATEKWDGIESLAPYLSVLILSEMELFAITKAETVGAAASMILDWGCKIVVVTLGPKGAIAYTKEEVIEQNTLVVEVFLHIY
jgi:sugar/nucleoside kinase (ribokinase family)